MADIFTQLRATVSSNPELVETSKPYSRKNLERTETETRDYIKWKSTSKLTTLLNYLSEECQKNQSMPTKTHDGIDFYSTSTSRGFRMHPALTRFADAHVQHLFDFLKERLISLDYQEVLSDTRVFRRTGYWVETIHRHVLKSSNTEGCYSENLLGGFSQITIELLLKDNRLCSLRFEATIPNTELPRPTDEFANLIQALPA